MIEVFHSHQPHLTWLSRGDAYLLRYAIDATHKATQAEPLAIGSEIWIDISAAIPIRLCLIKMIPQAFLVT
jgi:hypothetical protein